jgi:hypothetical protein
MSTNLPARPAPRGAASFLVPLTAFLLGHFALGLVVTDSFPCDDADQLLFSQELAWGYHEQPPLYSWIMWLAVRLLGPAPVAVAAVRTLALGALVLFAWLAARQHLRDERAAALTAGALTLVPAMSWGAINQFTHTTLLCAAVAATWAALLRALDTGRRGDYALLGLAVAAGVLAKYTYLPFAAALAAAVASLPECRARLRPAGLAVAAVVAAVLTLPHLAWLAARLDAVLPMLAAKASPPPDLPPAAAAALGVGQLALTALLLLAPLLAASSLLGPPAQAPTGPAVRLPRRFLLVAFGLVAVGVIAAGGGRVLDRWLLPFAVAAPLALAGRRGPRRPRAWAGVLGLAAVGLLSARAAQAFVGSGVDRGRYPLHMCFGEAADAVRAAAGPDGTVIATDRVLAGNLRMRLPGVRHLCVGHPLYRPRVAGGVPRVVAVWNAADGEMLPPLLGRMAAEELRAARPVAADGGSVRLVPLRPGRAVNRLRYAVLTAGPAAAPGSPPRHAPPEVVERPPQAFAAADLRLPAEQLAGPADVRPPHPRVVRR